MGKRYSQTPEYKEKQAAADAQAEAKRAEASVAIKESGVEVKQVSLDRTTGDIMRGKSDVPVDQLNPDQQYVLGIARLNEQLYAGDITPEAYAKETNQSYTKLIEQTDQRTLDFAWSSEKSATSEAAKQQEARDVAALDGTALGTIQKDGTAKGSTNSKVSENNIDSFVESQKRPVQPSVFEQADNLTALGLSTLYNTDMNAPLSPDVGKKPTKGVTDMLQDNGGSYIGFGPNNEPILGPVRPTYSVELNGKIRTFKDEETALKFIQRTSKDEPMIGPIGNLSYTFGQPYQTWLGEATEKTLFELDKAAAYKPEDPFLRITKETLADPLIGLSKATLSSFAFFGNLGRQAGSLITGKEPKTKETKIPDTFIGKITENLIGGKDTDTQINDALAYTKKYGVSGVMGELAEVGLGFGGIKSPVKFIPIFAPTGKQISKEVTVFGKTIATKTSQGTKLGSTKPMLEDVAELKTGFEIIKGGKQQTSYNIKLIKETEKAGMIDPVFARISTNLIDAQKLSQNAPTKVFAKSTQQVEGLTGKQVKAQVDTLKELQNPPITAKVKGEKPIGQIGGSFAENQQINPKLTGGALPKSGDFDIVVIDTATGQKVARTSTTSLQPLALRGQEFVSYGPRFTKASYVFSGAKTDFPIFQGKNIYYHGTSLENAVRIANKGFSLRSSGKQTKEYLERVTENLTYSKKRSSQISPEKTIFMTPRGTKALEFAKSAAKNSDDKLGLLRIQLKDDARILRLKKFDPKKEELAADIASAKKKGYEGILKPMGGPKSNLELILFTNRPIKKVDLVEKTRLPLNKKEAGKNKFLEALDDKDLTEGDLQAIKSGQELGAKYLGKKLPGKGIKGADGERIEALPEQFTKRITSFLTLHDSQTLAKQAKKFQGTPPKVEKFDKELSLNPLLKRAEKDSVKLVMTGKTIATNLQTVKVKNPVNLIRNPGKGKKLEDIMSEVERDIKTVLPNINWDMYKAIDNIAELSMRTPKDYSSASKIPMIVSGMSKGPIWTATPRDTPEILNPKISPKIKQNITSPTTPISKTTSLVSHSPRISVKSPLVSSRPNSIQSMSSRIPSRVSIQSISSSTSSSTSSKKSPSISSRPSITSLISKSPSVKSPSPKSPTSKSPLIKSPSPKSPTSKSPLIKSPGSPGSPGSPFVPSKPSKSPRIRYSALNPGVSIRQNRKVVPLIIKWKTGKSEGKERPSKPRHDFLGSSSEYSIEGLYNRKETTYGKKKISLLRGQDKKKFSKKTKLF